MSGRNFSVEDYLGPGGVIANALDGYEPRQVQVEMAGLVKEAFDDDLKLIVEAGTGTGKTLAYLLPAIMSGKKVVISTATKTLQDQIYLKDIPFLKKKVPEAHLSISGHARASLEGSSSEGKDRSPFRVFRTAQMKGRTNYLCKKRFREFAQAPLFDYLNDAKQFDKIRAWVSKTKTGDRSEIEGLSDLFRPWRDMSATAEQCLGTKCPDFEDCFISEMRRRAFAADIIIVNHHLYFADLAVRESNFGEVIPGHDAVVFDEAHSLASIARNYFGVEVGDRRIENLVRDIERWFRYEKKKISGTLNAMLKNLYTNSNRFFGQLPDDPKSYRLESCDQFGKAVQAGAGLEQSLKDLAQSLPAETGSSEDGDALGARALAMAGDLKFVLSTNEEGFVYWCEVRQRSKAVIANPIDLEDVLSSTLYSRKGPMIFTSATLSANEKFDYFKADMGFKAEAIEAKLESPFDYTKQTVFYVPGNRSPDPRDGNFADFVADEMESLVKASKGRAFLLFTSQRNLDHVYRLLSSRLEYRILKQGDAPKHELLIRFQEREPAVLFATMSFWQGVDVRGEALSLVAIDKLPFSPPGDPLMQARMEMVEKDGKSGFSEILLPEAILLLKQGLGRLIRTSTDKGILALMDKRIVTKGYGGDFLRSLPRFNMVRDHEALLRAAAGLGGKS